MMAAGGKPACVFFEEEGSMRRCGVLMPVSGLWSPYGIGAFSKEAYEFVDFLEQAGQSLWQILPLGPTGYGDSPYQSFSTFAGNPYYIDLKVLADRGWLTGKECDDCDFGDCRDFIEYDKIYKQRFKLLRKAYENSDISRDGDFIRFCDKNADWLEDYALYMAIKKSFGGVGWLAWEEDIRLRKREALKYYREKCSDEIGFYRFEQYLFQSQWFALKDYANKKGIRIIGDIPIYVALDSADVWAGRELFQLNEDGTPKAVAGCPPDFFSETGQLWGNPLYNWDYHRETDYDWWMKRIGYCYELYDIVRIDHFRGFDEYYSIPCGDSTAEFGHWEKGPGISVFETMRRKLGEREVIAEDLGFVTDTVRDLVEKSGFPGMKILQFAFDSREEGDYMPYRYPVNCVVYTGTHDNDTVMGWYDTLERKDKMTAKKYLDIRSGKNVHLVFIREALKSVADTVIIPIQDYLALRSEARINTPSTLGKNWRWRVRREMLTDDLAKQMRDLGVLYGRIDDERCSENMRRGGQVKEST